MTVARTVVLIPYYNARVGLIDSLASFGPSEICDVLVVDDGSDKQPADVRSAQTTFTGRGSVTVLRLPENVGIEGALNAGLDAITDQPYEFIARLDCGDRNVPDRIQRQEAFLDEHPDVLLVGGAADCVDPASGQGFVLRHPLSHEEIVAAMQRNSAFVHPTVMFRTSALHLVGRYPTDTPAAEDYAFFWRFLRAGRVANLPDVLITYELNPGGISLSGRRRQLDSRLAVQRANSDGSWRARTGMLRTRVLRMLPYGLVYRLKRTVVHEGR
jgi:glycosyltransferase involved in cell wall biosynthesis